MPNRLSPAAACFRTLVLGAILLVFGRESSANDEPKPLDVWVGKWTASSNYEDGAKFPWWFSIAPANQGYAIQVHTASPAEILMMTKDRLEFRFNDELRTHIRLKLMGPTSIAGTVTQPNNSTYPTGNVVGMRVSSFGGFFLEGPTQLTWGQEAKYRLVYAKDGLRKTWHADTQWRVGRPRDREIELAGRKHASVRALKTPASARRFDEVHVRLRAWGVGSPIAEALARAELTVTITNAPGHCKELGAAIAAAKRRVDDTQAKIGALYAELAALDYPNPWDPEIDRRLKAELAKEGKRVADLTKADSQLEQAIANARSAQQRHRALLVKLRGITMPAGRARVLLNWYSKSAHAADARRKQQLQVDFVEQWTGERPRRESVDTEFMAAWEDIRRKVIARVGVGLVQIGGLVVAATGGGKTAPQSLANLMSFYLGVYADQRFDTPAIMRDVKLSDEAMASFAGAWTTVGQVASRYQAREAAGASEKELHEIEVEINRVALDAYEHLIHARSSMRPLLQRMQRMQRTGRPVLRRHEGRLARLHEQDRKNALAAHERDYDALDVRHRRGLTSEKLEAAVAALAELEQESERLQRLHAEYCAIPR